MSNTGHTADSDEFRPMRPDERELVLFLVENGLPEGRNLLSQVDTATVRNDCPCGCPSIEFNVPISEHMEGSGKSRIADFDGGTEEFPVNVMLWIGGGVLRNLEVTDYRGDLPRPFALPALDTLRGVLCDKWSGR